MTDKERENIRKKISCPQFGDDHYGEWGILNINQRRTIKRMLDFIDGQENYIKSQQAEIERLTINMNAFGLGMKREKERADTTRAEAIKEFAEKLKDVFTTIDGTFECCEVEEYIDNLVKEMAGEDK